jgi:Sec-independent protein secretion pathway component TatC
MQNMGRIPAIRELIKIIVSVLLAVLLSIISYQYLIAFFSEYEINSQIKNPFESASHYGLYAQCLMLFFALISLPFIFSALADKLKINKNNLSKIIVMLEIAGFLLAYITTPPDFVSTIIVFIAWQLPMVVNLFTLLKIAKGR